MTRRCMSLVCLLALAVSAGLFFGLIRSARRRFGKQTDDEQMISLHL